MICDFQTLYYTIVSMDQSFYNRIDYKGPIETLLKRVCRDFGLGTYISYELVPFGYEDFNVVLHTGKNTYFVKIFGSFRNRDECKRYVKIMETVYRNRMPYPFLYESSKKHLYETAIGNTMARLVVQEFIDGKNFIELEIEPNKKEKEFIIRQAALINKFNIKPKPVYDSWAVANFEKEFQKRGQYLPSAIKENTKSLLSEFLKISFNNLPHCFVHGDIIRSNVMKDTNGTIYILDFAVSNFYPRIIELATLICFNFFDPDNPISLNDAFDFTLKTYQKFTPLEKYERKMLPIYIKASFAMYALRASYEKIVNKNESEENKHWLKVGKIGLTSTLAQPTK